MLMTTFPATHIAALAIAIFSAIAAARRLARAAARARAMRGGYRLDPT